MGQFPIAEAEIVALAQAIIGGLQADADKYPVPPVTSEALAAQLNDVVAAQNALNNAQSTMQQAMSAKNTAFKELARDMKSVLRYAELMSNKDPVALKRLGWGVATSRKSTTAPGQCRMLEAGRRGEDWVELIWKAPAEGGKVVAYKVQRRAKQSNRWEDAATALDTEVSLSDQQRGVELEFRVVAINKAGEGQPSNSVLVVL